MNAAWAAIQKARSDTYGKVSDLSGTASTRPVTEAQRIAGLPRWNAEALAGLDLTEKHRRPEGTFTLTATQSLVLHFAETCPGVLGHIAVGGGKGLLSMLLPSAMKAKKPVLLLPPKLVETFHREYRKFRPHFRLCENLKVIPYSMLSVASGADLLVAFSPDLIILDEAHELKRPEAARTKRFLRYCRQFPATRVVPMSGTLTKRGLLDYAHLAELSLREGSPLPQVAADLLAWANVVDADGVPRADDYWSMLELLPAGWQGLEDEERRSVARSAFRERLRATVGVVCTSGGSAENALTFTPLPFEEPGGIREARLALEQDWVRPDGEELESPLAVYRVQSQLSSGFFYLWDWPDGVVDTEWMEARGRWHRAVRSILKRDLAEFDSPLRVARGIVSGRLDDKEARSAYEGWVEQRHKLKPPTKTVWLDSFLIEQAVAWAIALLEKKQEGILWYEHAAVGEALAQAGLRVYGAGEDLDTATSPPVFAAAIRVHGTGKNLQRYAKNFVLNWPGDGATCEQLVGRTHRQGQEADEVEVFYPEHTPQAREAVRRALRDARYIEDTQGTQQKLCRGTWTSPVSDDEEGGKIYTR